MKKMFFSKKQAGFSLVELIIAGVLMTGMLVASGVFTFSGDNSKSTNVLSVIKELGSAATRYAADTGVNPKIPQGLYDKAKTTTADTHEGIASATNWKGPYINAFTPGTGGIYPLTSFVDGSSATFAQITSGLPSGASTGEEVVVSGLPLAMTLAITGDCNGTSYTETTMEAITDHSTGAQCVGAFNNTTKVGTVKYLYKAR